MTLSTVLETIKEFCKLTIFLGMAIIFLSLGFAMNNNTLKEDFWKASSTSMGAVEKTSSASMVKVIADYKEVKEEMDGASNQAIVSTELAFISTFEDNGRIYFMATLDPKEDDYSELIPFEENTELSHTQFATISFMEDGTTKVKAFYGNPEKAFEISPIETKKIFNIIAPTQTLNQLENDQAL